VLGSAGAADRGADGRYDERRSSHFVLLQDVDIDRRSGWRGSRRFEIEVLDVLEAAFPGRCLWLSDAEKRAFAANCIALTNTDVFMSAAADAGLSTDARSTLVDWGFRIRSTDLSQLELAGGSLRCMITEIF